MAIKRTGLFLLVVLVVFGALYAGARFAGVNGTSRAAAKEFPPTVDTSWYSRATVLATAWLEVKDGTPVFPEQAPATPAWTVIELPAGTPEPTPQWSEEQIAQAKELASLVLQPLSDYSACKNFDAYSEYFTAQGRHEYLEGCELWKETGAVIESVEFGEVRIFDENPWARSYPDTLVVGADMEFRVTHEGKELSGRGPTGLVLKWEGDRWKILHLSAPEE
jgi:hypothetical protein